MEFSDSINPIPDTRIYEKNAPKKLERHQQDLYNSLLRKDLSLAEMYYGALKVMDDPGNPDRISQAAHSLRELMEKIPKFVDVPVKASSGSLKNEVKNLQTLWNKTLKKTACYNNQNWNGQLDQPIKKLLNKLIAFFTWFTQHSPRRREEFALTLRKLDMSGIPLPQPLENLNIQGWQEMKDFFQKVSHHGRPVTQEDFSKWIYALEKFLLDRLCPRTFEDFDTIDSLIKKGESDA